MANNVFQNGILHNLVNRNAKILGRRLSSPSLTDEACLEDAQLFFIRLCFFFHEPRLDFPNFTDNV